MALMQRVFALTLVMTLVIWTMVKPVQGESSSQKVDAKGDIIFGGLFPMHEKGTHGKNCGKIKKEKGIQRLEAMLLAVDLINNDEKLLPGLQVGMRILDTCSYDTFALEQCMDFIKAQLSTIDLEDYRCDDDQSPAYHRLKPVAGVIGAASSTVSIMVANILRLFKVGTFQIFFLLFCVSRVLVASIKVQVLTPSLSQSVKFPG